MACPGVNKDYVEKEKPLPGPEVLEANLGAEVCAALQFFPPLSFEPLRSATFKSARRYTKIRRMLPRATAFGPRCEVALLPPSIMSDHYDANQ